MARQLFLFAIFLTFSLVSPAWAERDVPVQPDRPLITFVELDKRQLLVVGSGPGSLSAAPGAALTDY